MLQVPQVGIARDDVIGLFLQGAGQKLVVGGIVDDPVGLIEVLGDDGLSEDQPKKPPHVFFFGLEARLDGVTPTFILPAATKNIFLIIQLVIFLFFCSGSMANYEFE